MYRWSYIPGGERLVGELGESLYPFFAQLLQPSTNAAEGQVEYQRHDA